MKSRKHKYLYKKKQNRFKKKKHDKTETQTMGLLMFCKVITILIMYCVSKYKINNNACCYICCDVCNAWYAQCFNCDMILCKKLGYTTVSVVTVILYFIEITYYFHKANGYCCYYFVVSVVSCCWCCCWYYCCQAYLVLFSLYVV